MSLGSGVIPAWLLLGELWQDDEGKWWCDPYKHANKKDYEPETLLGPFDSHGEAMKAWRDAP